MGDKLRGAPLVTRARRSACAVVAVALLLGVLPATSVALPPPQWFEVASMSVAREGPTATLLPSGKVLVAGGETNAGVTAAAELYDPATRSWSPAASMSTPRTYHAATLLANGKVLVTGGRDPNDPKASAELYDPATNSWAAAASMHGAYSNHALFRLASGSVLMVPGSGPPELYDPTTDEWTAGTQAPGQIGGYTPVLLANDKVLTVGGSGRGGVASGLARIYDPAGDVWSDAASMGVGRTQPTVTRLQDGRVLVAGGSNLPLPTPISTSEVYDPATDTWSTPVMMPNAFGGFVANLLADGTVLMVGGGDDSRASQVYDPATGTWAQGARLNEPRRAPRLVLLPDGGLLAVGGWIGDVRLASAEVYEVDSTAPAAPVLSATSPASPANVDSVNLIGTAEASSTVRVYTSLGCSGPPVAEGSAASFGATGIAAAVAADTATTFHVTATDTSGNVSPCSLSAVTFVEDSTPPDTTIVNAPPALSLSASASFAFATSEPGASARFQCRFDDAAFGSCSPPVTRDSLGEGAHTFEVRATDAAGNVDLTPARYVWVVDTVAPIARFTAAPDPALAGRVVTFDGSASSDANGEIAQYEWDLDGDGTFERAAAGIAYRYVDPGTYGVQLRVTDRAGRTATARAVQRVTADTHGGGAQLGISINGGARYTKDPSVTIRATSPSFATQMLLANDGGFAQAKAFAPQRLTSWTLASAGADRAPARVYVRFTRGLSVSETYSDDIILDERTPVVTSARVVAPKGAGAPLLQLRARDRGLSGVSSVQVTNNRRAPLAKFRASRATVKLTRQRGERRLSLRAPIYVRVRDRAGNLSVWRRAAVARRSGRA